MAQKAYGGVNNVARNGIKLYGGVNGVARNIIKGYVGINGVARQFWGAVQKSKHLIQVFDEDYVNGQTYDMGKSSVADTIRYAIEEWIYLDRYTNILNSDLKDKLKNTINSIIAYANNLNPNADYVVANVNIQSYSPLTYRVNVYIANADTSVTRVSANETINGYRRYISSITGVSLTNMSAFNCLVRTDTVTFEAITTGNSNFLGTLFNGTNSSLTSKNVGVHYIEREEDGYIAKWDFINSNAYDEVDQTAIDVGGNYTLVWDADGIHLAYNRGGKLVLPCYYSLLYKDIVYEIDYGSLSIQDSSKSGKIFVIPVGNNVWNGFYWNGSEGCYSLYENSTGWHNTTITNFNYFANSTLKIEINNNTWKIYRNNTLEFSYTFTNDKQQYTSSFELGDTYSYNSYDAAVKEIRIYETGKIIVPQITKVYDILHNYSAGTYTITEKGKYLLIFSGGAGTGEVSIGMPQGRVSILEDNLSVTAGGYARWMKYKIVELEQGDIITHSAFTTSQWMNVQGTIYKLEGIDINNSSSVVASVSQADGAAILPSGILQSQDLYFAFGVAGGRYPQGANRDDTIIGQPEPIVYIKGQGVGYAVVNGLYYAKGANMPTVSMYGYNGGAAYVVCIKL